MRLYGNLINRMLEGLDGQPTPEVGMPITVCHWSDRQVYHITDVITSRKFIVEDCLVVTLRKNGMWRFAGETMNGGAGIVINLDDAYRDPSF